MIKGQAALYPLFGLHDLALLGVDTMVRYFLLSSFVILLLSSSCVSTASSSGVVRYQFAATPAGLLRLNQETGETHAFFRGAWVPVGELDVGLDRLLGAGVQGY